MSDMLVKLYNIKNETQIINKLSISGIKINRAIAADQRKVLAFIKENFDENYVDECRSAFSNNPITCYIATKNKTIIGFACYEVTAKNYFGPMGVDINERRIGVGCALLNKCLLSMSELGYGYAIIGWPTTSAIQFYEKTVQATLICDSYPGIYHRMIDMD